MEEQGTLIEQEIKGQGRFVGKYLHALDPKKRITIPSQWRAQVGSPNSLYVLPDVDSKSLCVFPASEMKSRIERVRQHSMGDKVARNFLRIVGPQSDLVSWDTQGRIRVKDELLELAGITEQVQLVGVIIGFELWNPKRFKESGSMDASKLGDAARSIGF